MKTFIAFVSLFVVSFGVSVHAQNDLESMPQVEEYLKNQKYEHAKKRLEDELGKQNFRLLSLTLREVSHHKNYSLYETLAHKIKPGFDKRACLDGVMRSVSFIQYTE